jgi:hypothetical protein
MTRRLLATLVVAALLPAAAADAKVLHGTVVHRNHKAHSFVVAGRSGKLSAIHARSAPRLGRRVTMRARALSNGTFSAKSFKVRGRSDRARLAGTVSFVDAASRTFTLSDDGASILVHVADDTIALPAVGDVVRVVANLNDSTATTVEAPAVQIVPAPATDTVKLEGVVLAIDQTTRTLMLSADDSDASGQAVSVVLPDTFDITKFAVGDRIEILATLNADGTTFTAVSSSGDDNATEADDQGDDQGDDQAGDNSQGDEGQGDDDGGQTQLSGDSSGDNQSGQDGGNSGSGSDSSGSGPGGSDG